ncbi:YggT family protein [Hyphococcus sp.]|uniref:YggT family protein n=1 Tax=Hyphococcus sp. TaxID=2038636 RepID=UPI003CCC2415
MIPMPVFSLIDAILQLYTLIVFVMVIMSWLIGFNVINRHNQVVDMIWRTLIALTEPVLGPIRRTLPSLGGLDISPLVLLLAIFFLREMNWWIAARIGIQ